MQDLERNPSIGSPAPARMLRIGEIRTWRLPGLALTFWYFVRVDHIEVIRLVGQRAGSIVELDWPPQELTQRNASLLELRWPHPPTASSQPEVL